MRPEPATGGPVSGHASPPITREPVAQEALQPYLETLRLVLPTPDEILRRARRRKRRLTAAASLALLAILSTGLRLWNPVLEQHTLQMRIGQRGHWTLSDGSTLALNTDSRIAMRYRLFSREFTLEQGEAIFTAAHSALRSFTVQAGPVLIEDIGTVFAVRHTDQGAQIGVMVLEGRVDVLDAQGRRHILREQDALRLTQAGTHTTHRDADPDRLAWRDGKLLFRQTPLGTVLSEIQRYRQAPIRLHDNSLATLPITGQFELGNLEDILAFLPRIAPLAVQKQSDGSLDIRRRPAK